MTVITTSDGRVWAPACAGATILDGRVTGLWLAVLGPANRLLTFWVNPAKAGIQWLPFFLGQQSDLLLDCYKMNDPADNCDRTNPLV